MEVDLNIAHIIFNGVVYQVLNADRTDWDEAATAEQYNAAVAAAASSQPA